MRIAEILNAELSAFYSLQQTDDFNRGAVLNYYADLPGTLMSPYAAQVALRYALAAYRNHRAPAPLISMTQNYIAYALKKIMWTLEQAKQPGVDTAGAKFQAGADIMTLYDGSMFALPTAYRTPAGQGGGKLADYNAEQQARVRKNIGQLFIKGCPLTQYARQSDGHILPGWVLQTPDMSFATPIAEVKGVAYQEIHDAWYDATDSYCGTLVALIGEYLHTQPDAAFKAWLLHNWQPLLAVVDASLATLDPLTKLAIATPYTYAEYTLDNMEVWRGLKEFCYIMQRALLVSHSTFSAPFDATGKTPADQFDHYNLAAVQIASSITKYCRQRRFGLNGAFTPGWNGKAQTSLKPYTNDNPAFLDAFSFTLLDSYAWGDTVNSHSIATPKSTYLSTMAAIGLSKPSETTDPSIWRYIIGADAIGQPGAPFSLAAYVNWVSDVNAICIQHAHRNYKCWWSVESAALIWLCNILLHKGAA
jgi:hypothetical protein